jgi:GT2 family glycosyltransferase
VFVDNGSTDGTLEYLRSLPSTIVIDNGQNLGFGAGCNQGIAASSGEFLLLLNNDTVVTPGWLEALQAGLAANPRHGIAGPRSNNVAGTQLVNDVSYDVWELSGLDEFAASWTASHRAMRSLESRLIGFCMLIKREVIDAIGGFDLRFGLGNFEDDDLCVRAGVAGFDCVRCDDSYVHHFGSRTFIGSKLDHGAHMNEAWERFAQKWSARPILSNGVLTGYDAWSIVHDTTFDPKRHFAPLVAIADPEIDITFEHRGRSVLLPANRRDADATRHLFSTALSTLGPADDVTLVVRVDPRDADSLTTLEDVADTITGELPDIVVVESSDWNDTAAVLACDFVATYGSDTYALRGLATSCDRQPVPVEELATTLRRITAA